MATDTTTAATCKVGDIVLFTLDSGLHHGEDRPAIVVRVILPETPEEEAKEEKAGEEGHAPVEGETPVVEGQPVEASAPPVEGEKKALTPEEEAAEEAREKEVLVDLLVFTAGAEDFETGHEGLGGTWLRSGIRQNTSADAVPNHWR